MSLDETLVEYLYVDDERLDAYSEQIGSLITYDKVPVWKAGIKITGPVAEATQARHGRNLTRHEKIVGLFEYLRKSSLLLYKRPQFEESESFIFERLNAIRAFIPPRPGSPEFPGLALWVSLGPTLVPERMYRERPFGHLFLLESFRRNDERPHAFSGCSILEMLAKSLDEQLYKGLFGDAPKNLDARSRVEKQLSDDPVELLGRLGAQIGPTRDLSALYRIRISFLDQNKYPSSPLTTIGYPIVVAAGGTLSSVGRAKD